MKNSSDFRPCVIDFHTHVFPSKIAKHAETVMTGQQDVFKWHTDGTYTGLMESMKKYGIAVSVTHPVVTRIGTEANINRFAAEQLSVPGMIPFGGIHPLDPEARRHIDEISETGFPGIKLHPEYQQFDIDSEEAVKAIRYAVEKGPLVMVHAGKDIAYPDGMRARPDKMRRMLDSVDASRVIAAHGGGWSLWKDAAKLLKDTAVMVDTAVVPGIAGTEDIEIMLEAFGPDRILFGTDSPWADQGNTVGLVSEWPLSADERIRIYSGNAVRLLGLDPGKLPELT